MQVPINTNDWQVLRQTLRTRRPTKGLALRMDLRQRTKDGSFLTTLVRHGLLQVVTPGETPFDASYSLTDRGKHAAEFGVYEVDFEEYKTFR